MIGARELTFLNPESKDCDIGALTLKDMEISHIRTALDVCGGNISRAANQLGIDRSTLTRKIKRHGITRP
jgi:transcriptional regulator of acetoin/glycerol metabolism